MSTNVSDIENIQYETQELSGINNSITTFNIPAVLDSYPSVPSFRVNVPEVSEASAKFVYNFFTANEREIINNEENILNVSYSRDEEIFFQTNNDKKPRYVSLSFKPPKRSTSIKELRDAILIRNNIDKIIIEGGLSNSDFMSFEIVDTLKEKTLYSILDGATFITEINTDGNSPKDNYNKLLEAQQDGKLTGEEKKLIASALQGIQSNGYRIASSDIGEEDKTLADDLVSRQNFSIQVNKLAFDQIVESAIRIPDSLFQDEFFSIKEKAIEANAYAIRKNSSNKENENIYTTFVNPISSTPIDIENLTENFSNYPVIKHAGYLINKLEVEENGLYTSRGQLISDNPEGLFIIDENVRYGGVYVYEIRSIYYVKMIAEERVSENSLLDSLSIVEVLMASEGKLTSVQCIEQKPPPPPSNLRISLDYKTRKPRLNWQFPINPQRDIKRFQIFKRQNESQPFTLIAEFDFDNSTIKSSVAEIANEKSLYQIPYPKVTFVDNSWEEGEKPIYAIASVDAHGLSSNYSVQIKFIYNKRLNKSENILFSLPNAPKPYPNLLINKDSFEDAIKISGYDRMKIYFDPEYYKVTKFINGSNTREEDLNFLRIDSNNDTYQIHMINIDNHKDKILNIRIGDFSGDPDGAISV